AGYGITYTDPATKVPRYYFISRDFRYQTDQSFAERGIGQDRLQTWLATIPAKKSILTFDTCESGTLTGVQQGASLRGGFEQLAAVGRLIQATGRTTLTAALDDQPALEGYHEHGVFTFAMLDALARGDRNGDGLISLTELIEHVDGLVPEITSKVWGKRQIVASGSLPSSMTLSPISGVLSGTPRQSGTFGFDVGVADATTGPPDPANPDFAVLASFQLTVARFQITTPSALPPAVRGQPYSQNLGIGGGTAPYTWSLGKGSSPLPFGMIVTSSGVLNGTPRESGSFKFDVGAIDSTTGTAIGAS